MDTFTDKQQKAHRAAFMEDCRQKAWNAACNADYVAKHFDELLAEYEKLKKEDVDSEQQIKLLDGAIDYHTKDNRDKRKALQERRNVLAKQLQFLQQSSAEAQQVMQQLYANVERHLVLGKHAETWEWKEAGEPANSAATLDRL